MYLPPDTHLLCDFYISYVSYWLFSSTGLGGGRVSMVSQRSATGTQMLTQRVKHIDAASIKRIKEPMGVSWLTALVKGRALDLLLFLPGR